MDIQIYTSSSINNSIKLITTINGARNCNDTIITRNIEHMCLINEFDIDSDALIILMIDNTHDFDVLITNKEKFFNNRAIIILSEYNIEMINKSYLLNPRYIEFSDSDFSDIVEIINKISKEQARYSFLLRSFCSDYHQYDSTQVR